MQRLPALILVCVLSGLAAGQSTPPAQPGSRDAQALTLLSNCAAAMGSAAILDTYATGTITPAQPNLAAGSITTWTKGAAERHDLSIGGDEQTYVMNQGHSWSGHQGQHKPLPYAIAAYHRPEHTPALACVLDFPNPQMSMVYVGQEMVHNRQLHHIKIFVPPSDKDHTVAMLSQLNVYIDPATSLIVKTERLVFDPQAFQNFSVWSTSYGDYRPIKQVQMPFHIETYIDGRKLNDIVLTDVRVNIGVPDTQFQ